jgi:SNF2 family DNA or RNA helicase
MNMAVTPFREEITPLPHQWQTLGFQLENKICYNLSACGSGKTLPAVLAIAALYESKAEERILVIAPLSVITSTWRDHLAQFSPGIPIMCMDVSAKRKKQVKELVGFKGIVLINPDGVQSVWHDLCYWKPGLLVIDELAGYYRNVRTNRWKACASLIYKCQPARWAFTGTPITKNLMDAYAQILLVNPSMMPRSQRTGKVITYVQFRDMLMTNPAPHIWVPKHDAMARVHSLMQPAIRFGREVMGDIKTPIRIRKDIALTAEQKALLQQLIADGKAKYGSSHINAKEAMTLVTKAAQIALGEVYDSKGNTVNVPSGPRVQALLDVFDEVDQTPVIVSVPYIPALLALAENLRLKGWRVAVIYGDTKQPDRADQIQRFQRGEYDFLLCHPKTLAHGVTLTRSSTVVWYGPNYDLELYAQLNDRVFRYGQKGQPLVIEFSSTQIENRIYAAIHGKEALSGKFVDLFGDLM